MNDNNGCEHLDNIVSNHLQNSASLFDRVSLLENVVYDQDCRLFGLASRKQKNLSGICRRAQQSISLVKKKSLLMKQIETSSDIIVKKSFKTLLNNVHSCLRSLCRGETSKKRHWKIKQANQGFLRNSYKVSKSVLDPKCGIRLKCEKRTLDDFKIQSLSHSFFDAELPHLKCLPSAPSILKDFNESTFKVEDLSTILCSRRNGSSSGINMIPYKVYEKYL